MYFNPIAIRTIDFGDDREDTRNQHVRWYYGCGEAGKGDTLWHLQRTALISASSLDITVFKLTDKL